MRDHRFWRELIIRGGMTAVLAAIAYFLLGAEPWIWGLPLTISALVVLKWALRPEAPDDALDEDASSPDGA
jgi:hypothetical protein